MHILWLSHLIPYPPKGGVLQRSHHLFKELAKHHTLDLLAFNQKDLIGPLFKNYEEGIEESRKVLSEYCRKLEFVDIDSDNQVFGRYLLALKSLITKDPYNINWLKSKRYMQLAQQWAAETEYDLVHFDTISLVPYFEVFHNRPKALDHHNIESHMLIRRAEHDSNLLKKLYYWQEGRRLKKAELRYCPQFEMNITCSDIDTRRLSEISPESNVETVPNGVDTDFFKSANAEELPNSLIFVGTLSWYPNAEAVSFIAEQLWEPLMQEIPDIRVDIVGANPPKSILSAAEKYENFTVHGFVDDILPLIDRASLYICPIQDGGGTKLKILDAFAMGKAVIAHPIACEGIEVTADENVVFANSVSEYVSGIKSLLNDPARRQQLGQNARRLAEDKYSYASIGKQLADLYDNCVNK